MRNPHVAIVEAAKKGKGLRLTADEVWDLYQDSAIVIRAAVFQEQEKYVKEPRAKKRKSDEKH